MTWRRLLSTELILAWADHHHAATGRWPNTGSGPILLEPIETWSRINLALYKGHRGLPGGDTLARLLAREREVRNPRDVPTLTEDRIARWAQIHFEQTGAWPVAESDPVPGESGEEWIGIDGCLRCGYRGLPGGDSLAKLLARRLGVRNRTNQPPLSVEAILIWAELHRAKTGRWPGRNSTLEGLPDGEAWVSIDASLRKGCRGLPGGSSLAKLLRERSARHRKPVA